MHSLIRVLVNCNSCLKNLSVIAENRETAIDVIREYAEEATEGNCYDWRETKTAGRWSDEYPENVVLGMEHPDVLLEELIHCKMKRENTIIETLTRISNYYGTTDLAKICKSESGNSQGSFYLDTLISTLLGTSPLDTFFYDTENGTTTILENTIADVKENPQNWAIVFFDYHY